MFRKDIGERGVQNVFFFFLHTTCCCSVLSPYHQQVRKLRLLFRQAGLGGVDIGGVRSVQGRERKVQNRLALL